MTVFSRPMQRHDWRIENSTKSNSSSSDGNVYATSVTLFLCGPSLKFRPLKVRSIFRCSLLSQDLAMRRRSSGGIVALNISDSVIYLYYTISPVGCGIILANVH